jgi:hypothetical protein
VASLEVRRDVTLDSIVPIVLCHAGGGWAGPINTPAVVCACASGRAHLGGEGGTMTDLSVRGAMCQWHL